MLLDQKSYRNFCNRSHLETKRLVLRHFHRPDSAEVARIAGDEKISSSTTNIPHPYTQKNAFDWIKGQALARAEGFGLHWALVMKESDTLIGSCSLQVDLKDKTAHLGYWVGAEWWGKGFATEAARLVTEESFAAGVEKLAARCLKDNFGSVQVLRRCGFLQEGLLLNHVIRQGRRQDILCFGRMREKSSSH